MSTFDKILHPAGPPCVCAQKDFFLLSTSDSGAVTPHSAPRPRRSPTDTGERGAHACTCLISRRGLFICNEMPAELLQEPLERHQSRSGRFFFFILLEIYFSLMSSDGSLASGPVLKPREPLSDSEPTHPVQELAAFHSVSL